MSDISGMGHQQFAEEDAEERREEAKREADLAQSKAESRVFPRLRLNVVGTSPGYVSCSVFQSGNGGTNWACSGTDLTFDEDWFHGVFGTPEKGSRYEFELVGVHGVTG